MRVSISAPHGVSTTSISPDTIDTEFNAFQDEMGNLFGTNDIQGGLNGHGDFGSFMASSADPMVDGSLGHTPGFGAVLGNGSMLNPSAFEEFHRLVIFRTYINNQSRIVAQAEGLELDKHLKEGQSQAEGLELDKHLKEAQSQAFDQMLHESNKVCTVDQYRWVYSDIIFALENVDHLESGQIKLAFNKIMSARESIGDREVSPRLRKLMCTHYPHWGTEEQKAAVLIPTGPEISASLSSSQFEEYFPPLHQLIESGSPAMCNLFSRIGQHRSRRKTDHLGQNLVHAAAAKGDVDLLKILSDLPTTDIDARDRYGRTPAFIAASLGQENALEFLHMKGANLSSRTYETTTILKAAATSNHVGIIRKLEALRYDFAEKTMRGDSPLTIAVQNGCHEAVHALLRCGVDPAFRRHSDQKTAQEVASSMNSPAIAEILSQWR
ncbi:MAG: hypothetical protein Q9178_000050 [Gyalolechia marmorata]